MERVLGNEISRWVILSGMAFAGLSAVMIRMIAGLRRNGKPFQLSSLIYLLVCLLAFALAGSCNFYYFFTSWPATFIFYQFFFLVTGIVHCYAMPRFLLLKGSGATFWQELIFTVTIALTGAIAFICLFSLLHKDSMQYFLASGIIFFLIPFFYLETFRRFCAIPAEQLKQWHYPVDEVLSEPDENKMKNLIVISFQFQKQENSPEFTNFRAKAPTDMELGQLFYYFINEYNERNTNNKIHYSSKDGNPYGWIFYKRPRLVLSGKQYMQADTTVFLNNIRENDVIICSRFLNE